jgi:hypothetical protein
MPRGAAGGADVGTARARAEALSVPETAADGARTGSYDLALSARTGRRFW